MKTVGFWIFLCLSFCFSELSFKANGETCQVNNLPLLTNSTSLPTQTISNSFMIIISSYSFTCCGNVTAWGVYLNLPSTTNVRRSSAQLTFDFQVWRRQDNGINDDTSCMYTLIGNNTIKSPAITDNMFICNVSTTDQIGFQTDDIIGIQVTPSDNIATNNTMYMTSENVDGFNRTLEETSARQNTESVTCQSIGRLTLVPVITVSIEPTPCPMDPTTPPTLSPPTPEGNNPQQLSEGAITGIVISAVLVVLLCSIITLVCLVTICVKKSKRKRQRPRTFGKARFIRSIYLLPKRYAASKDNDINADRVKEPPGIEDSASVREEVVIVLKGAGQDGENKTDNNNENEDWYVNVQKVTSFKPTKEKKATEKETVAKAEAETDDAFYENNPFARKYYKEREKREERKATKSEEDEELDNKQAYINQEVFARPSSLDTHHQSKLKKKLNDEEELYVNTMRDQEEFMESPLYVNQDISISTRTNKAYGVTTRPDGDGDLQYRQRQEKGKEEKEDEGEREREREGEGIEGEDEYVYVEVNADEPEEVYQDMASFGVE